MRLNLGCGTKQIPGFLNVDLDRACNPDSVCDVSSIDSLVPDESVEEIVAFDIIEHFDKYQAVEILKHWRRKLALGGFLLLRTNDIDRLVRLYASQRFLDIQTNFNAELFIWHFMCEHDKPGMGHKWGYTPESIMGALTAAGFHKMQVIDEGNVTAGKYPYADCNDNTNLVIIAYK